MVKEKTRQSSCRGSAALLSLYDGLDLLDSFEVTRNYLLQKYLQDLFHRRCFSVGSAALSFYDGLNILDAFELNNLLSVEKGLRI